MAYAEDKLYNDVIRKMMGNLASKVRTREIIALLPCLTLSDREEIDAKRETAGNYCAMMVLLDNLRRRENWPDHFINALRTCEQGAFANEISEAYDKIRGIGSQRTTTSTALDPVTLAAPPAAPSKASAAVTTVTVPHSISPLVAPSVDGQAQNASPGNSPPGPKSNKAAPALTETPTLVSAPDVLIHAPTETGHPTEPPNLVLAPDVRSPSPVFDPSLTLFTEQSRVTVSYRDTSKINDQISSDPEPHIHSLPKPCDNIASVAFTEPLAIFSPQEASKQPRCELAHPVHPPVLAPVHASKVSPSVGQSKEPAAITADSGLSSVAGPTLPTNQITISSQVSKSTTILQPSSLPEESKIPASVIDSTTSVKNPIQDTNPPGTVSTQGSQNNPIISQIVERAQTTDSQTCQPQETSQVIHTASADAIAGCMSNVPVEYFSKPGVLRGEEPSSVSSDPLQISNVTTDRSPIQPARPQTVLNPYRTQEPTEVSVSLTSDDLMISSSTTGVPSQIVTDPIVPVRNDNPMALENGFAEADNKSYPNQPVEDHYESAGQSLQTESHIRMHIVEVSEEPPVQNLSGHSPSMFRTVTKGESDILVKSVSEASQNISQSIQRNNEQATSAIGVSPNVNPLDPFNNVQSEQREKSSGMLHRIMSNSYLIGAAAIGIMAVFVALKFKH